VNARSLVRSFAALAWAGALLAGEAAEEGVGFNGATSYAVVEDGGAFDLDAFTLAARVKLRRATDAQVFLNRGRSGSLFTLYLYEGRVRMLVEFQKGRYTHANVAPPRPGVWTHLAGTYDGEQIRIYVDGELKHTAKAPGRMPASKAPLYLGAAEQGERVLDGALDDVCVWRRALEAHEIAESAVGKTPADGLVARWLASALEGTAWRSTPDARLAAVYHANPKPVFLKASGYRGIWYSNQPQKDEYVYKYSGGLGTYCAKHRPFAIYAPKVNKTFFCYGGTDPDRRTLLHMVSFYDHATGTVPRPTILLDKRTTDAHDNPVIAIDDAGHVWIFSSSHGTGRPSYISVSTKPYAVDEFERVLTTNFSYTQPWWVPGRGFLFLHTRYSGGRRLYQMTSPDGRTWSEPALLAAIEMGHYQVSWRQGSRVATAFNFHPKPRGLNWRTNLYYMETSDLGATWHNAQGQKLELPLTAPDNPALVHDYRAEQRNVYMKDVAFDADGRPIILYITSKGWQSGPRNDPRTWTTARWTGTEWDIQGHIVSDNNYDMGSLTVDSDGRWRLIGPTQPGPQRHNTGGEVALWTSTDKGHTWAMERQLTRNSPMNHTYCRKVVDGRADLYALWADGHGRQPSESRLYFCDRDGRRVLRLPPTMTAEAARPEPVE